MVRVSVSLIDWEGEAGEPGAVPTGARRIAKAVAIARPGQQATLLLGHEDADGGALLDGVRIEVEPNIGANNQVIDLRLSFERQGGAAQVSQSAGFTLVTGTPLLVPLGRIDGEPLGLVLDATVVGADGTPK